MPSSYRGAFAQLNTLLQPCTRTHTHTHKTQPSRSRAAAVHFRNAPQQSLPHPSHDEDDVARFPTPNGGVGGAILHHDARLRLTVPLDDRCRVS
jgi:hypothetical protein